MLRIGKISAIAAILILLAAVAIPNLLSTSYVKQRIASQLSELTGRSVSLNGSSTVSLRPYLGVSYRDVIISDQRDEEGAPLVVMEGLRGRLGLLAALWGDAELTELELIRPQFNLHVDRSGTKNWLPDSGLLGTALHPDTSADAASLDLGTVKVIDGKLKLNDDIKRQTQELTAINGELNWPNTNGNANATISAVWRGENTKTSLFSDNFKDLLQGKPTNIAVKFTSKPLTLDFSGELQGHFKEAIGTLTASSTSPRRLAEWLDWRMTAANGMESSSISGEASYKDNELEFAEAVIQIGENEGRGRIQFLFDGSEVSNVDGTLSFTSLDLPDIVPFLVSDSTAREKNASRLPDFQNFVADVRLSAKVANSGSIQLDDLAASLLIRDGMASFDIGSASAIDGTIAGSISLKSQDGTIQTASDLTLMDIDLAQLTGRFRGNGFSLEGNGDVTIKVKSSADDVDGLISRLNGEGSLLSLDGNLIGLDFAELYKSSSSGSDSVARITQASTSFDRLELNFFIANGTVFVRNSGMIGEDISLPITGRSDLVRESLALRGKVIPTENNNEKPRPLPFFIGGTANAPLIVPLPAAIGFRTDTGKANSKQP